MVRKFLFLTLVFALVFPSSVLSDWEPLGSAPLPPIKDLLAFRGKIYAISANLGVFVSSDYGDNWVQSNEGLGTSFVNSMALVDTVLLLATYDQGVYRSTTYGITWTRVVDTVMERNIFSFAVDQRNVYLLTEGSSIFKSTNLGVTWEKINTSEIDAVITSFTVRDGKFYVGTMNSNLYYSSDEGKTWTDISNGKLFSSINTILVDGNDVFCGTEFGISHTSNLGQIWNHKNVGIKFPKIRFISIINNALIVSVKDGGLYFSFNKGLSWIEFNENLPEMNVISLAADNYYIYAGTEYSYIARRSIGELKVPEVKAPKLIFPPNLATNIELTVSFSWEISKGAVGYHLLVSNSEDFAPNSILYDFDNLTNNYYFGLQFRPNRKYYWKVAAIDELNVKKWSETFSFQTIVDSTPPLLHFPPNNHEITQIPIRFTWSDLGLVEHYKFQLATDNLFQNVIVEKITKDTMVSVVDELENNKTYYWRVFVRFLNGFDTVSKTLTFTTKVLSVGEDNLETWFKFYQTSEKLIFVFEEKENRIFSIEIFDLLGRRVLFDWFETSSNESSIYFDISRLKTGVYYYVVRSGTFVKRSSFVVTK
ncbi:MAG: T9SS type A sorting domain-containing protein [Ignavibacteria bacterium]|nr:T9SS type A sorting domain-containing protein [Ignavibacteria bacterium]